MHRSSRRLDGFTAPLLLATAGLVMFAPTATTSDHQAAGSFGVYQSDGCSDGGCDDQDNKHGKDDPGSDGAGANTKDKCARFDPTCIYGTNKSDGIKGKDDK